MKLVILDRDGTLNQWSEQGFIGHPDAWVAVPGALEAVASLNRAGWHVVVATNQPGLGRGLFDVIELNAVHAKMHKELAVAGARVEAVFYCPHAPDEDCSCRKPAPALFEQIAERYGAEGDEIWAIGSGVDHLQAAATLGANLLFVGLTEQKEHPSLLQLPPNTVCYADLHAAAQVVMAAEQAKELARAALQAQATAVAPGPDA